MSVHHDRAQTSFILILRGKSKASQRSIAYLLMVKCWHNLCIDFQCARRTPVGVATPLFQSGENEWQGPPQT
jgi:hypothetical protein